MRFLRKIRRLIMDSLGFSKTEANGFIIVLLLVFGVAIIPRAFIRSYLNKEDVVETSQSLTEWVDKMKSSISIKEDMKENEAYEIKELTSFDPNVSSVSEMMNGGLPRYLAERIINYRKKGGDFENTDDLRKLYGMTDSLFNKVRPYVTITPVFKKKRQTRDSNYFKPKWEEKEVVRFGLNTATAEELQEVRGIGPVLSERIIKYRDLLGGFHSIDQLKEVWGLKEEVILEIVDHADLNVNVQQLSINTDSIKYLAKHPYIDYNLARAIINYKVVHGDYQTVADLQKIKVMNDSIYQKLSPYLSL